MRAASKVKSQTEDDVSVRSDDDKSESESTMLGVPSEQRLASMEQLTLDHIETVYIRNVPIVSITIDGVKRLCLAQISSTLLASYSYNEIHNRRVALGINCVQCSPAQLELLRRVGAMPSSSRRCGMITYREADRLVRSFLDNPEPPKLPRDFVFNVEHDCGWGCKGSFHVARYTSSRAKCVCCATCLCFFSPNKFIFHFHRNASGTYKHPDAANFNSWRRHLFLQSRETSVDLVYAWEDVKAMFNGGNRKRPSTPTSEDNVTPDIEPVGNDKSTPDAFDAPENDANQDQADLAPEPLVRPKTSRKSEQKRAREAKKAKVCEELPFRVQPNVNSASCFGQQILALGANPNHASTSNTDSHEFTNLIESLTSQLIPAPAPAPQSRFPLLPGHPLFTSQSQNVDVSNILVSRFVQSLFQCYQQNVALGLQQQQQQQQQQNLLSALELTRRGEADRGLRYADRPAGFYSVPKLMNMD